MSIKYFKSADDFRRWLEKNHPTTPELWVGYWSAVNIKRAQELSDKGLMKPAGMAAFNARKENKSGIYSYEQRSANLDGPYEKRLKR
jgi:hypothetical protein